MYIFKRAKILYTKQKLKKIQKYALTNYQYNIKICEISLKTTVQNQFWLLIWTLPRNCIIIVATKQNLLLDVKCEHTYINYLCVPKILRVQLK